jgi:hypothetical protein
LSRLSYVVSCTQVLRRFRRDYVPRDLRNQPADYIAELLREARYRPAVLDVGPDLANPLCHVDIRGNDGVDAVRILPECFGDSILDRSDPGAVHILVDVDPDDGVFAEDDAIGIFDAFYAFGEHLEMGRYLLRIADRFLPRVSRLSFQAIGGRLRRRLFRTTACGAYGKSYQHKPYDSAGVHLIQLHYGYHHAILEGCPDRLRDERKAITGVMFIGGSVPCHALAM